ncbi:hypothetical protein TVAG_055040 [Trichomonas vaginalis G3]|uniref:VPS9 domain-containing protein n=1 Tax=Trichomonas vaginalis (strain ATCC PRA-98 / G3) TaxID=412133 RepID=A2ETH2_TRIV3|nr:hypothetical protein TVAG_055040 [Trichomonas vaginalis G3]|eukprot:XP_001316241.1 hypothetical protein [Trichomonas vaginalis G3]
MQQAIQERLETFMAGKKKAINFVKRKEQTTKYYQSPYKLNPHASLLNFINSYVKNYDSQIIKYELESLQHLIELATDMRTFLQEHPNVNIDADLFCLKLDDYARNNEQYITIRNYRKCFYKKSKQIYLRITSSDITSQIRLEFIHANSKFDKDLYYSPPSNFDELLITYILQSSIQDSVQPTVQMIVDGNPDLALSAISDFCLKVYDLLNVSNEFSKAVVYTSVVRFLFDEAYTVHSELYKYNKANSIFMLKAEEFSKQSVRELRLSKDILKNYTPGLSVSSMFKSKQLGLMKMMELMTNPIDLMKHVHTTISALAQYFGGDGEMLSFDDTLTLLLGLMSLSPPSNAISIAKFVDKWSCIQLSDIVGRAKDFFIAAVEMLMEGEDIDSPE